MKFPTGLINLPADIQLDRYEFIEAAMAGALRVSRVVYDGLGETHGSKRNENWLRHPEGALAERAVAKLLNRHWNGVGEKIKHTPDVGRNIEVRWTGTTGLFLHDDDIPNHLYFAVTGGLGAYKVHGWIWGREGILDEWWNEKVPRHAYVIPFGDLRTVLKDDGSW